jgi:hypothetical protein
MQCVIFFVYSLLAAHQWREKRKEGGREGRREGRKERGKEGGREYASRRHMLIMNPKKRKRKIRKPQSHRYADVVSTSLIIDILAEKLLEY